MHEPIEFCHEGMDYFAAWSAPYFFFFAPAVFAARIAAHRFRCASAIRFRAAALIVRFFRAGAFADAGWTKSGTVEVA
jgi:hypothetical protein